MVSACRLLRCHNIVHFFCMVQTPLRRNMMVNYIVYISGVIYGLLTSSLTIVITNLLLMVNSIFFSKRSDPLTQITRTDLAPFVCVIIYRSMPLLRNMMVNLMGLMHGTFFFARLTCCCFRTLYRVYSWFTHVASCVRYNELATYGKLASSFQNVLTR